MAPPCRTSLQWFTGAGVPSVGFARRWKVRCICSSPARCRPSAPEAEWILKDYEDNRYLSNQYGYVLEDFDRDWFGRGGMSMQACLLLDVEPYLYRDDVKQALRALFNGQAVSYFPDVRMNTEHALPDISEWRGDHFKSSDEANMAGWLRYLFVREEGDTLLIGQAVPRDWLRAGAEMRHRTHGHLLWPNQRALRGRAKSNHGAARRADAQSAQTNPPAFSRTQRPPAAIRGG